ncbi:CDP-diacylglycerol-glycerol-3-phosphate 3-phosphatidyltransferase [Obba rivulosa]|uniref:CDP-diacylglycerol--glycerol-3-phosphate 3-phosphatidyltransferase n=1 Tax=Obba rivulosa TaxID=1052685 RepID=A0A8E2DQF4_9APHY|nr:CDP-diacylglycerol-glycerol-3-phosphate 3-phosphatidyltransferase [Obba rivulosa]
MLAVRSSSALLRQCDTAVKLTTSSVRHIHGFSLSSLDPAVRHFASKLAEHQPCFPMSSSNVHILHEPKDFYQRLLDMVRHARRRLFISTLYIGSEDTELIDTMHASLRRNPDLQIHIHLDYNRSTRPEPRSAARLLLPLTRDYPDRVHVYLFRSPKLKGLLARLVPPRFNEGWGTWHPKIYGADDDVLISGANLNSSYFTNRQDRYIYLASQPQLAQYCCKFLEAASTFSYSLLPGSSAEQDYVLQWRDEHTHPHHIEAKAAKVLKEFQASFMGTPTEARSEPSPLDEKQSAQSEPDVLVLPVIQAGQFNIREEEQCLDMLFTELSRHATPRGSKLSDYDGPLVDLTSGYFGLHKPYQDLVLRSHAACRILAASPKANGFLGSRGISGRIPEGYTFLEQRFMKAVRAAGLEWSPADRDAPPPGPGVQLREWEKDGWTYHAKGIWLRPTATSDPVLTLFGSTNLNSRSSNLDTELSFVLLTSAPALRARLGAEVDHLRAHAQPWRGAERRVRLGTKALVFAVGGML